MGAEKKRNRYFVERSVAQMKVRVLNRIEISNALPLIWDVFSEYEAVNYPANGKQAFWDAIHSEEYLNMLSAYGAFDGKELIGIIAMRNEGSHVALFFVKGTYHGRGIGRELWNTVLAENTSENVTVHSSLYAVPIYEKLGFVPTGDVQEEHGIQYVPMKYKK